MGSNEDQSGCLKAVPAKHCSLQQEAPLLPHQQIMEENINSDHACEEDISAQTVWEMLLGY